MRVVLMAFRKTGQVMAMMLLSCLRAMRWSENTVSEALSAGY